MARWTHWNSFDPDSVTTVEPDIIAVFEIADKNLRLLDVGSGRLRDELRVRLPGGEAAVPRGRYFSFHRVNGGDNEEQLLKARMLEYRRVLLIKEETGKPPRNWQMR